MQEQQVLEELNRLARLRDKTNLSHPLGRANGWALAKKALLKATAGPGRYTNTGRAAPGVSAARVPAVLHDPGGTSDPVHRQTL